MVCGVLLRSAGDLRVHERGQRHAEQQRRLNQQSLPAQPEADTGSRSAGRFDPPSWTVLRPGVSVLQHENADVGMLEVMASEPRLAGCANLVLMDLPYFLQLGDWDNLEFVHPSVQSEEAFYGELAAALAGVCHPKTGGVVLFYNEKHMNALTQALQRTGFRFIDHLWVISAKVCSTQSACVLGGTS